MKLEINLSSDEKIEYLADIGFPELLDLPEEHLVRPLTSNKSKNVLFLLAKSGCKELVNYPNYLSLQNKYGRSVLYELLENTDDLEKLEYIIQRVGLDKIKEIKGGLHGLAKKGYVDILNYEESFNDFDTKGYLPVFYLLENCREEDFDRVLRDSRILLNYKTKNNENDFSGYPLHYLRSNGNCRPTFNKIKKYFNVDVKIHHNTKFSSSILRAILDSNRSLRFITMN